MLRMVASNVVKLLRALKILPHCKLQMLNNRSKLIYLLNLMLIFTVELANVLKQKSRLKHYSASNILLNLLLNISSKLFVFSAKFLL